MLKYTLYVFSISLLLSSDQNRFDLIENEHYQILFDNSAKIPLKASYYLTKDEVQNRLNIERKDHFSTYNRTRSSYYRNSGFDRGHFISAEQMSYDSTAYYSTFSMCNIFPQSPKLNRGLWRFAEDEALRFAEKYECIHIEITAVKSGKRIKGGVVIPERLIYKVNSCEGLELLNINVQNL